MGRSPPGSAPETALRAAELEVEATDLELLEGVRRPLDVLLQAVVLVRLDHRDPREVLEEELGHLLVRVAAELLVDREPRGVAELVELRMAPVVLRSARAEESPHHAVRIPQGRGGIGPPESLEVFLADPLRAYRVLEDLDLRVDAHVAPHRLDGLGHRLVAGHVAGRGLDDDLLALVPGLLEPRLGLGRIEGERWQRGVEVIVAL